MIIKFFVIGQCPVSQCPVVPMKIVDEDKMAIKIMVVFLLRFRVLNWLTVRCQMITMVVMVMPIPQMIM